MKNNLNMKNNNDMKISMKELLNKLLGDISVYCETNHDKDVYDNLDNYKNVVSYLIDELAKTSHWKDDYRGGADSCGTKAYDILKSIKEDIDDILE